MRPVGRPAKTCVQPCARCFTPEGYRPPGRVTPLRYRGAPFGYAVGSEVCRTCYTYLHGVPANDKRAVALRLQRLAAWVLKFQQAREARDREGQGRARAMMVRLALAATAGPASVEREQQEVTA